MTALSITLTGCGKTETTNSAALKEEVDKKEISAPVSQNTSTSTEEQKPKENEHSLVKFYNSIKEDGSIQSLDLKLGKTTLNDLTKKYGEIEEIARENFPHYSPVAFKNKHIKFYPYISSDDLYYDETAGYENNKNLKLPIQIISIPVKDRLIEIPTSPEKIKHLLGNPIEEVLVKREHDRNGDRDFIRHLYNNDVTQYYLMIYKKGSINIQFVGLEEENAITSVYIFKNDNDQEGKNKSENNTNELVNLQVNESKKSQPCYIRKIFSQQGKTYIDADYVEVYLNDQAGIEADKDKVDSPPNGIYIRNNNTKLRTLELDNNVSITIKSYDGKDYTKESEKFTLAKFKGMFSNDIAITENPYYLTVQNGKVTKIVQQFMP